VSVVASVEKRKIAMVDLLKLAVAEGHPAATIAALPGQIRCCHLAWHSGLQRRNQNS